MHGETQYGAVQRGFRAFAKAAAVACSLSVAFLACSDGGKKSVPKVVTNPNDGKPVDGGKVLSALDSLVKSTKGTGKGVVTGFLTGEGKSIAKGLLKQASNAAGEVRMLTRAEIPLTGATVLIFNAEKPTTLPDATLKTDSTGTYTGVLAEGKYFGFAVYLDLETFQLVTTQIPNMNPIKDTVIKMDTAVAIEDVTSPTVVGVYDAAAANDDGVFLVGSVPDRNAKINITFSEPMNRESAKGVMIGRVDTSSSATSLVLADTLTDTSKVKKTWSGDSKELTLNVTELSAGVQYGIIIPVSLKDLAKNPLEAAYKATFAPVAAKDIEAVAFAVASTFPEADGSVKPIQNPGLSFNRPVEVFSVIKGAKIEPAVTGYWEVVGARAVFVHKAPLVVGTTYTVSLPDSVRDLAGNKLGKSFSYKFTVKDYEGAAKEATGANQAIALAVEAMFDAYTAGDLGRFSAAFHANFRMFEGSQIFSKTQFLDMMKQDIAERVNMTAGFPAPVFDNDSASCKDNIQRWKVGAVGDAAAWVWVESFVQPGAVPRVWGQDKAEIDRTKIAWDRTGPRFTLNGKVYGFAPDFSKFAGGVNLDAARDNGRFMADIMAKTSTIVLEPVKLTLTETFKVDGGMAVSGDTARLAVKLSGTEKHSRTNFDPGRSCKGGAATNEFFQILKFLLVNDGTRWVVLSIVAPEGEIKAEDFNKTVDVTGSNFGGSTAAGLTLVKPVNGAVNAAGADGSVVFEFNGVKHDSVGGYLVGIAEDPKFTGGRPPFGTLLFVKATNKTGGKETFTLDASAKVSAGEASAVLRRVQDLRLPGWERTLFEYTLDKLHDAANGKAGVYQWKVIAIKDTSAAQFLANGFKPERFYGESDFGGTRGYFAVKAFPAGAAFEQFNNQTFIQPPVNGTAGGPVGFGDMDQDGVPDFIEQKYGSDMRDRNSYPDFRVDTDGDKLCDFLEKKLDPTGKDSLIDKKGDEAAIKAQIAALAKLTPPILFEDSDADGFPDDIEQMLGFNPRDALHNPGTKARASTPVGVFSGKIAMGAVQHTVSLKLYQDSVKNLWVALTAYFGKDTIVDTSRASFNELMGEVAMALPLPKNGPDSGKALLLRGRYEALSALLMGPIDMILAPASKTTVNFGGGPFVGQFAASGRGEDVSRYLPGQGGNMGPGPIVNNPINNPPMPGGYRQPPQGTNEGAQVVFAGTGLILIDDFGDTLATFPTVNWRGQPDGSFEMMAEVRSEIRNGTTPVGMKRSEVGGRIYLAGDNWVLEGHFFQSKDSSGIHKDIPGQHCSKALKADLKRNTSGPGLTGTLKGWIFQDKLGGGFVGPVNPNPTCPPGTVCQPNPTCPAGQVCNPTGPTLPPTNSFSIPYMGSAARVVDFEKNVLGGSEGLHAYVQMGGRVYWTDLDDSTLVSDAKAPLCGQVQVKLKLVPLKEGATDAAKAAHMEDSILLSRIPQGNILILIEAQGSPGKPAIVDKARDANGDVQAQLYVVEPRPVPPDYGRSTMVCNPTGPINPTCPAGQVCNPTPTCPAGQVCNPTPTCPAGQICNPTPTCPAGQVCNPNPGPGPVMGALKAFVGSLETVKTALQASQNSVLVRKDTVSAPTRLSVELSSLKQDTLKKHVSVTPFGQPDMILVFLADSTGQKLVIVENAPLTIVAPKETNPGPGPGPLAPMYLQATVQDVLGGLALSQNKVVLVRDSAGTLLDAGIATISPSTVKADTMLKGISANTLEKPDVKVGFLAQGDVKTPMMKNNMPVVIELRPAPTGTQCPAGQTCPPPGGTTNPAPGDTTKPPFYKGTVEEMRSVMTKYNWMAELLGPPGTQPQMAEINSSSLRSEAGLVIASEVGQDTRIYIFLGSKTNAANPLFTPNGKPAVVLKPVTAGP